MESNNADLMTNRKGMETMETLNREAWLNLITDKHLRLHFENKGFTIPDNIRMSCSLTSRKQAIGQCWSSVASEDNHFEIFIHPSEADSIRVVDILIHELCHAVVGLEAGHKKPFKQCAEAVGLTGKMTSTYATQELKDQIIEWVNDIGQYPHAPLLSDGTKKQSTRMIKCVCKHCEYQVYTSKKWIEVAIPTCPDESCEAYGWAMQVNLPDESGEE